MTQGTRVLVIEDEMIVAQDLKNSLSNLGYDVVGIANSGEEAVEQALLTHPDLLLVDIRLKGDMDGVDAVQQILIRVDTAVVYLTAYSDRTTLNRAKITEPYGYLLKPFHPKELQTTVEMALHKHFNESARMEQLNNTVSDKDLHILEMMNRSYNEKVQLASYFQSNIDRSVLPALRKIMAKAGPDIRAEVAIIEKRLANIVSPFVSKLENCFAGLSPRETEICQLVKDGMPTKEIAATLNTSTETVRHQRKVIRRKLGISQDKINLRSFLETV